jgi:hypothetical protein
VIVRIMTEGQYQLGDEALAKVNELDNACVAAVEAGDEDGFHEHFEALLHLIRTEGTELADDDLHGSDVLIPPSDTTFAEAAGEFTGDGLIPD